MKSVHKTVVLGDSGVGKSTLIYRLSRGSFLQPSVTIWGEFQTVKLSDTIKLQMWDPSGQERFRALPQVFYRNTDVYIAVVDMSKGQNHEEIIGEIDFWLTKVERDSSDNVIKCLVGAKSDIQHPSALKTIEMKDLAIKTWNMDYFETSSRNGDGFDSLQYYLCERITKEVLRSQSIQFTQNMHLQGLAAVPPKKSCKC
ncbi:hypothetical protein FGO68_gene16028 [Halteria grandinella]|uniref:Uncharacterized protein n=1 Tax=Halteria grandinella TaxID=5974 RepID=A0A8J8NJM7_HALGN|nr:hypothetical protein FGO68_gene16028 [Halteria grandinella]